MTQDAGALRRRYSDEALRGIPRLLLMIDRNRYSSTYGSFDRSYWHYRTMDFPCGMSQEFCLPLAHAYVCECPDNEFRGVERVRELAWAGIDFAMRSAHRDGSCDDYFPYERALGALVFSLNAMTEAALLLNERRPEWLEFFARRADCLCKRNETGKLTNHQALAALALYQTYQITGEERFRRASDDFVRIVREWFHPEEGWFQEYEGADPGYQSCTVTFLGRLWKKSGNDALLQMLNPAVDFCWHFVHPDGSYAGEYGSRNTYHFYADGFEILAPQNPKAAQIADVFLERALPNRSRYYNDDDRMCAHYLCDWFWAYEDFSAKRSDESVTERVPFARWFPKARMYARWDGAAHAALNLGKGGVLKVTTEKGPVYSDTGMIAKLDDGRVIVSHLVDDYEIAADAAAGKFGVRGKMCERKAKLPTPAKQILFRIINLTLGRFAPNLLRSLLQKVLITGKPRTGIEFERTFEFGEDKIAVGNRVKLEGGATIKEAHIGSDATSIYVANSNTYQRSVLLPWRELTKLRDEANRSSEGTEEVIVKTAVTP